MALHWVMTAAPSLLTAVQNALNEEDVIVLLGDAVLLTQQWSVAVYYRKHDAELRGLSTFLSGFAHAKAIEDSVWVDLTAQHHPIISWK